MGRTIITCSVKTTVSPPVKHIIKQGHHLSLDNANILKKVNELRRLDYYESLHISTNH